jgi:putative NADH-flavin reductase
MMGQDKIKPSNCNDDPPFPDQRRQHTMKVIVFGPTGGTGLAMIHHAVEKGWEVTAFARSPHKLNMPAGSSIRVVKGDVLDADTVAKAIPGHDAVLVALGGGGGQLLFENNTCSKGTENIVKGMQQAGVKRIIVISSMGAGQSKPHIGAFPRWLLKYALEDKTLQEKCVMDSGLEYVIVRPTGLTNGPVHGHLAIVDSNESPVPHNSISRNDVAIFALNACQGTTYLGKCPGIAFDHRCTEEDSTST